MASWLIQNSRFSQGFFFSLPIFLQYHNSIWFSHVQLWATLDLVRSIWKPLQRKKLVKSSQFRNFCDIRKQANHKKTL